MTNDDCRMADAARRTIQALRQRDHTLHADTLELSMRPLLRGGSMAPVKTWRHWLDLTSDAYDLLWDEGAEHVSELLAFCICQELRALEAGVVAEEERGAA